MAQKRFAVIGVGPAGHAAAPSAARYGADVTLIERDIVGGSAHLRDYVPAKTMIATGSALSFAGHLDDLGLANVSTSVATPHLRQRIGDIEDRLAEVACQMLASQGVRILSGSGRLLGPNEVCAYTADGAVELSADVVVLSTGSRPRIPEWAPIDGERILATRRTRPQSCPSTLSWRAQG